MSGELPEHKLTTKFLKNTYRSTLFWRGKRWPTLYHAFLAEKTTDALAQEEIRTAPSTSIAAMISRRSQMRDDWHAISSDIMQQLIRTKFENPFFRLQLEKLDAETIHEEVGEWVGEYIIRVKEELEGES